MLTINTPLKGQKMYNSKGQLVALSAGDIIIFHKKSNPMTISIISKEHGKLRWTKEMKGRHADDKMLIPAIQQDKSLYEGLWKLARIIAQSHGCEIDVAEEEEHYLRFPIIRDPIID